MFCAKYASMNQWASSCFLAVICAHIRAAAPPSGIVLFGEIELKTTAGSSLPRSEEVLRGKINFELQGSGGTIMRVRVLTSVVL